VSTSRIGEARQPLVAGLHCPSWARTRTLLIQSPPAGATFPDNLLGTGHFPSIGARFPAVVCPLIPGETTVKLRQSCRASVCVGDDRSTLDEQCPSAGAVDAKVLLVIRRTEQDHILAGPGRLSFTTDVRVVPCGSLQSARALRTNAYLLCMNTAGGQGLSRNSVFSAASSTRLPSRQRSAPVPGHRGCLTENGSRHRSVRYQLPPRQRKCGRTPAE
jgi:hypothetical protein